MTRQIIIKSVLLFLLISLLFSCATIPEEHSGAAKGAGIGAATGAVAGAILGRDTEGAILGALAGALVGGTIGHYAYDRKKTRVETQNDYNYRTTYGDVLAIEEAYAVPQTVNAGQTVELNMTYAVLTPSSETSTYITESRVITHNGNLVGNPEVRVNRQDGTYSSTVPLRLPVNADRGTYVVRSEIQANSTKDAKEFTFYVN